MPRCRTGGIQRHVDRIGFQRAEHGHDRRGHLRHQETNPISPPAPRFPQQVGEPVARLLELPVLEARILECQSGRLGARLRLRRHPLLQKHGHAATQRATARSNTTPV